MLEVMKMDEIKFTSSSVWEKRENPSKYWNGQEWNVSFTVEEEKKKLGDLFKNGISWTVWRLQIYFKKKSRGQLTCMARLNWEQVGWITEPWAGSLQTQGRNHTAMQLPSQPEELVKYFLSFLCPIFQNQTSFPNALSLNQSLRPQFVWFLSEAEVWRKSTD